MRVDKEKRMTDRKRERYVVGRKKGNKRQEKGKDRQK